MGYYDKKWCSYCGSEFHNTDHCPSTWQGQGNLLRRRCKYCGSKEHYIDECPSLR